MNNNFFDLNKALKSWRKTLRSQRNFEDGFIEELESHLLDEYSALLQNGLSEKEAFDSAAKKIGNSFELNEEYSKSISPLAKPEEWQSGSAYFFLLFNYIKIAYRHLFKNKSYSVINISGLALGIAAAIISFIIIADEFNYDNYHKNSKLIYRVIYERHLPGKIINSAVSPFPLGQTLKDEFSEIAEFTRFTKTYGKVLLRYNNISINEDEGAYADPGFLKIYDLDFIEGYKNTALDKPNSIILSETTAGKYFGDESALGKMILMEGKTEFIVTGVIKDIPENSHLKFNFLLPFELQEKWGADLSDWNNWGYSYTYILLNKGFDVDVLSNKIRNIVQSHIPDNKDKIRLQPLEEIHLDNNIEYDGYADIGSYDLIYIIIGITLIIIISAVINFINITTARGIKRISEVGLRKAIGASKKQIFSQMIGETFILVMIASALAIVIVFYALPLINQFDEKSYSVDMFSSQLITFLGITISILSLLAGGYPAVIISSFNISNALKNRSPLASGRSLFTKLLLASQFVLAMFLLTNSIFIRNQFNLLIDNELGYNSENIIFTQLKAESRSGYESLYNELSKIRGVSSITSAADFSPVYQKTTDVLDWKGKEENNSQYLYAGYIDFDYLKTFNLSLLEGRDFDASRYTDLSEAFIINEAAAEMFGFDNVVGEQIVLDGVAGNIIGVVENYQFLSLYYDVAPLVLCVRPIWRNIVFVKINPEENPGVTAEIKESWANLFPGVPFEYSYYDEQLAEQYVREERLKDVFSFFAILALAISLLGMWGFFSYIIERRSKEIAIRKVLGGSVVQIVYRLTRQYFQIFIFSNIFSWAATYYFINYWLENFALKISLDIRVFFISMLVGLITLFFAVVIKAIKKVYTNPVEAIRYE